LNWGAAISADKRRDWNRHDLQSVRRVIDAFGEKTKPAGRETRRPFIAQNPWNFAEIAI